MILDSSRLGDWQGCHRRGILSHKWLPERWRPKTLFDRVLRKAIFTLSTSVANTPQKIAATARAEFMDAASNPGLDVPGEHTYRTAKDWCAVLDTVIRSIARLTLLNVHAIPDKDEWKFTSWMDDSGQLHRWLTVDRWDDSAMRREMHSWRTMGDIAFAEAPMQLHVIVIGQQRIPQGDKSMMSRLHSPWARRYKHPTMPALKERFRSPTGKGLGSGWKAVWLADTPHEDPQDWVDQMWREGAAQPLLHHPTVNCPPVETCEDIRRQVGMEADAMEVTLASGMPWQMIPMARNSCDSGSGCPFRYCCHREKPLDPSEAGGYKLRGTSTKVITV